MVSFCDHGDELYRFCNSGVLLEQLNNCQHSRKTLQHGLYFSLVGQSFIYSMFVIHKFQRNSCI